MARRGHLGLNLSNSVDCSPKPIQCLSTPTAERFDGEGDQTPPWKRPSGVTAVFPLSRPRRRRAVRVSSSPEVRAALRVGYHDVPVHEGVGGPTSEAVVKPGLLDLGLPLGVDAGPCPRRLEYFGGASVPGRPPDPSENVPERVVPTDDEAADTAGEGMKPIGVELLGALPPRGFRWLCLSRVAAPLVPAPVAPTPEAQGDPQPEA